MSEPRLKHNLEPSTTICIRSYNRLEPLEAAVASCVSQSQPARILIIDDGSRQSTVNLIKRLVSGEKLVEARFLDRNLGPSNATNVAIESVTTRYLGFLDSDDFLDERYVEELEQALKSNPHFPIAYCRFFGGPRWTISGPDVFREALRQGHLSAHGTLFGEAEAFRAVPRLPTRDEISFDSCDDDRLSLELARRFPILHVPKDLYHYHTNTTERLTDQRKQMFNSYSLFFDDYAFDYGRMGLSFTLGSHYARLWLKYRPAGLNPVHYGIRCSNIQPRGLMKIAVFAGYWRRLIHGQALLCLRSSWRWISIFLVRIRGSWT